MRLADGGHARFDFRGTQEIALAEQDHRLDMSLGGHDEVTLETAPGEVRVAGLHDEGGVDIRRDHLIVDALSRRLAPQPGPRLTPAGLRGR